MTKSKKVWRSGETASAMVDSVRNKAPDNSVFLTSYRSISVPTIGPRNNIGAPRQKARNAIDEDEACHRYTGTVKIKKISSHSEKLDSACTQISLLDVFMMLIWMKKKCVFKYETVELMLTGESIQVAQPIYKAASVKVQRGVAQYADSWHSTIGAQQLMHATILRFIRSSVLLPSQICDALKPYEGLLWLSISISWVVLFFSWVFVCFCRKVPDCSDWYFLHFAPSLIFNNAH